MRSFDFLNGSHIECIDTDNNTTKRSSNAYKLLTNSASDLLSFISDKEKHFAKTGHYTSCVTGTEITLFNDGLKFGDNNGSLNIKNNKDSSMSFTYTPTSTIKDALDSIRLNRLDNPTLEIRMSDMESDAIKVYDRYIDHCKKLISKVYTNKEIPDYVKGEKHLYEVYFEDDIKGEKEMTKTKPTPRNYTILPEIDDYKVYKDKHGRDVAIVVTFTDGTKTKAVCNYDEGDKFDIQSGLAICFMRRLLGDVNIDPKTLDKYDRKKSLGYTEYNRFMRKTIRNHEKKIKQEEKEKERKAKELKERQEIDAKRSEKRKKEEMEKLSPVIDLLKGLNINDAIETLKSMANDNK